MKARVNLFVGTAMALTLAACGADDVASPGEGNLVIVQPPAPAPTPPPPPPSPTGPAASCPAGTVNVGTVANRRNCQISGRVTGALTLRNFRGVIYSLSGQVQIGADVGIAGDRPGGAQGILTVEPGVTVFGSSGADALIVNRGSQIFAEGNATTPIVFTSRANIEGTSTDNSIGQWGGVVIVGRAPITRSGTTPGEASIEGVSGVLYGGTNPADSSGRLRFVQVRYSGFEVQPGNELNGITLGGVGNGTTIENVQVHNSSDDGIEWFGGRVNHRNIALTGIDDDSIDTDNGYRGDLQYVIAIQRSTGGDRIIEADTAESTPAVPRSRPRIANFTFVSRCTADALLLRGGTDFTLINAIVTGSPVCLDVDNNQTIQAAIAGDDEGPPRFESVFLSCATPFRDEADVSAALIAAAFNAGTNNVSNGTSTLTGGFINGANEAARPAFQASTISTFFENPGYIGAVRDANDTRFRGWTCDSSTADFGSGRACTAAPADTGTAEVA